MSPNLSRPDLTAAAGSSNRWLASLAAERAGLEEDHEALRAREQNLKDYEARLRALQAEIERTRPAPSTAPGVRTGVTPSIFHRLADDVQSQDDPALHAAWEKLHRTRELLDAEQAHLRADRMTLRDQEAMLQRREEAIAARERQLAEREAMAPLRGVEPPAVAANAPASGLGSLSRAPFELARRMLGKRPE